MLTLRNCANVCKPVTLPSTAMNDHDKSSLDDPELREAVQSGLKAWGAASDPDSDMLNELLLVRTRHEELTRNETAVLPRLAINNLLLDAIADLKRQNPQLGDILDSRFIDKDTVRMVSNRLNLSVDQVNRRQAEAIDELTALIIQTETQLRQAVIGEMETALPPASYDRLFGFNDALDNLTQRMMAADDHWMAVIVGIGGIGKTAFADAVTRRLIRRLRFARVIWVRVDPGTLSGSFTDADQAQRTLVAHLHPLLYPDAPGGMLAQDRLRQVRARLKELPYLVIVDNLETVEDTFALLAQLRDWAEPSKFLLTSRTQPTGQAGVYIHTLSELSTRDAADLLRHHADKIGLYDLSTISDDDAQHITNLTGGNPLAIKLVVGLAHVMPLPHIMEQLGNVPTGEIADMYRHIYWQAWHSLSETARQLLQAMPLIGQEGGTLEQLRAISGLDGDAIWTAITQLVSRSLLETRGTVWERRYGIHRLTETFLNTDINFWNPGEALF